MMRTHTDVDEFSRGGVGFAIWRRGAASHWQPAIKVQRDNSRRDQLAKRTMMCRLAAFAIMPRPNDASAHSTSASLRACRTSVHVPAPKSMDGSDDNPGVGRIARLDS